MEESKEDTRQGRCVIDRLGFIFAISVGTETCKHMALSRSARFNLFQSNQFTHKAAAPPGTLVTRPAQYTCGPAGFRALHTHIHIQTDLNQHNRNRSRPPTRVQRRAPSGDRPVSMARRASPRRLGAAAHTRPGGIQAKRTAQSPRPRPVPNQSCEMEPWGPPSRPRYPRRRGVSPPSPPFRDPCWAKGVG